MIATVIVGRGSNREVIHRERNFAFSNALAQAICTKLGIARGKPALRKPKASKRRKGGRGN